MQMKQIRLAMFAAALVAGSAFAAQPFVGPSVGLSVSSVHTDVDFSGGLNNSMSSNRTAFDLNAGYGMELAPKVVLNGAMSINLNQPSAGSLGYSSTNSVTGKFKDRWSLSLAPGYLITPKLMAYGKVAYQYANIEVNDSAFPAQGAQTLHFHGWGYGIGVAYAPVDHLETSLEVQKTEYSTQRMNASTGRPTTTAVTLGAAWRF
ncbi:porin family protein [Paludibacterium purpuratum]|uniref:Opacity protein-like surface antigen n=1 Tax=Paludibacterium purpuratum TaxID=1144873 RepID=A0A4V3DVX5_9NEIS|nr:porin family protein [Paludibacterium purpuratum]TDR82619.1 opacity protein-like surface antigen [Paludibacterium purpuratum]